MNGIGRSLPCSLLSPKCTWGYRPAAAGGHSNKKNPWVQTQRSNSLSLTRPLQVLPVFVWRGVGKPSAKVVKTTPGSVAAVAEADCFSIGLAISNDFPNAAVEGFALLLESTDA